MENAILPPFYGRLDTKAESVDLDLENTTKGDLTKPTGKDTEELKLKKGRDRHESDVSI